MQEENKEINKLILGDNLEIMREMNSESIDLIYLDPPFFSNRNYEVIWGDEGEVRSFKDRWSGGIDHYIAWLKERVIEMHRLLKPTGSIFLHCDWHADAYIRVDILDRIFGLKNFLSAIDWCYEDIGGKATKYFKRKKDTIFFYQKSNSTKRVFNQQLKELSESTLKRYGKYFDKNGHITYQKLKDVSPGAFAKLKGFPDDLSAVWLDKNKGQPIGDWWTDITAIRRGFSEAIGYPTQKPEALMERIINCASNEGDVILDPFLGGGTTVAVAEKLNRRWIGIDQSVQAVKVSEFRLDKQSNLYSKPFSVHLHKYDYDTLRYKNAFQFEQWIIQQFGGTPNIKQRGDFGIDGISGNNVPIQVKRSDDIGRSVVDNFKAALERYDKKLYEKNKKANEPVGFIIAFSFNKGAVQEVARLKNKENIIIKLVTVEEIVPIANKPKLTLSICHNSTDSKGLHEFSFKAIANGNAEIEFYNWDFYYDAEKGFKPDVMLDKQGEQVWKFKSGKHTVAVKVVNNDGLESIEHRTFSMNGGFQEL